MIGISVIKPKRINKRVQLFLSAYILPVHSFFLHATPTPRECTKLRLARYRLHTFNIGKQTTFWNTRHAGIASPKRIDKRVYLSLLAYNLPVHSFSSAKPTHSAAASPVSTALYTEQREGCRETTPLFTIFKLKPPGGLFTQKSTAEWSLRTYKIFGKSQLVGAFNEDILVPATSCLRL